MTLMEALVVVAITALITGIGFVSFRADSEAAAWRSASAALAAEARGARAEALATDTPVRLAVAADGRSFGREGRAPVETPGEVRASAAQPIVFFTDGSSTGGAVLLDDGDRSTELTVDAATGLIGFRQAARR